MTTGTKRTNHMGESARTPLSGLGAGMGTVSNHATSSNLVSPQASERQTSPHPCTSWNTRGHATTRCHRQEGNHRALGTYAEVPLPDILVIFVPYSLWPTLQQHCQEIPKCLVTTKTALLLRLLIGRVPATPPPRPAPSGQCSER